MLWYVEIHVVVYAVVSGVGESETRNLVNPIRVVERSVRDYRVGIVDCHPLIARRRCATFM